MKILIINGPNLNLLGTRDTGVYGTGTLEELQNFISNSFLKHEIIFFQSNIEGEIIDKLQEAMKNGTDGLVTNLGAYTHTSVALRDALEPIGFPKVEVHISNIHARENFRERSLTGEVMDGIITGFGKHSYILGVQAIEHLSNQ
jgi:3-dehydroquinate dehydratase-2